MEKLNLPDIVILKNLRIFLVLFSLPFNSFAQNEMAVSEELVPSSKWTIAYDIGLGQQGENKLAVEQGFLVDYWFAKKWQIGTELKYAIFRGAFNHTFEEIGRDDLGQIINFTIVSPESASYFQIPINISYRQKKTQLSLGLSNCFLAIVRGRVVSSDPLASAVNLGNASPRNIEKYGFRPYHLRVHISGAFIIHKGFGCRFKIFQPISNLGKPPEEIPAGNPLFLSNKDRPGGFSFHFFYNFPKINF